MALLAAALAVVLVVQALFVLSYIGALHTPKPHHVAFGVVGRSVAVGEEAALRGIPAHDEQRAGEDDHRAEDDRCRERKVHAPTMITCGFGRRHTCLARRKRSILP